MPQHGPPHFCLPEHTENLFSLNCPPINLEIGCITKSNAQNPSSWGLRAVGGFCSLGPQNQRLFKTFYEGEKMVRLQLCLAIVLGLVFMGNANAQGKVSWTSGYPQASGSNMGSIAVKGSVSLDSGWNFIDGTIRVWKDGTEETLGTVNTDTSFEAEIGGLNSCDTYNVTVEFRLVDGCMNEVIIRTSVKPATPK
jgi:hypothetical protein